LIKILNQVFLGVANDKTWHLRSTVQVPHALLSTRQHKLGEHGLLYCLQLKKKGHCCIQLSQQLY